MEQTVTKPEVLPADWKEQIYAAETTRVNSIDPVEYARLIQQLDTLKKLLEADPVGEKFVGILAIIRLKVTTQMQLASLSPWVSKHIEHLLQARETIVTEHGSTVLFDKAKEVHEGLKGEKIEFVIELARDVAKYLDKVAKVTGDKSFHSLAARVLLMTTDTVDKEWEFQQKVTAAPERESYHLAHFERLLQLDLSGEVVDVGELFHYFTVLAEDDVDAEGKVKNQDRQAAVAWWLYEYGFRNHDQTMRHFGMDRLHHVFTGKETEEISSVERSKRKAKKWGYISKRLVANAYEMARRAQFNLKSNTEQTEIKQKLAL